MGILRQIVLFFRYYVDLVIDEVFGLWYNSRREYIPLIRNPILLESATSLANKIKKRQLTSQEIVKAFIDRINEVNPIINALVDNRFEEALAEAKKIDEDISSGNILEVDFDEKPFLGVPFTSKESTACKGLSWTFGLIKRKGKRASFDAACIESMKAAGAILLGVSNIPQLNLWQETSNPVYGLTKNPYDTTRNVGGSSGGESSLLAASATPLGVGTDIGGSCRIPAFMCGVFGHKITNNLVSTKGLTFRTGEESETMVSVGPMTRFAGDLKPFIKVLVGGGNVEKLKLDLPVPIKKLRVYYVTDPQDKLMSPLRDEMKQVLLKAVYHFKDTCEVKPEELFFEELQYQFKIWKYWMSCEGTNFRNDINNKEGEVNSIKEILQHFIVGGDFTTATILNLIGEHMKTGDWAIDMTKKLKEAFLAKLDDNSILLYPSAPFPASYHHTAILRPYNFACFAIWNALKFPATQVPMGLNYDGLPLGIQVVAAPFQDRLCLAVAKELENAFGGYVAPTVVAE